MSRVARTEILELYKILYYAEQPLSFEEIVEQLHLKQPAFRSASYRAYLAAHAELALPDDFFELPERDGPDAAKLKDAVERRRQTAWEWWVEQTLAYGIETGFYRVIRADNSAKKPSGRTPRDLKRWTTGRYTPWVTTPRRDEPWSPDVDQAAREFALRGRFMRQVDDAIRGLEQPKRTPQAIQDAIDVLKLGRDGFKNIKG